ncbi:hypothetical protein JCM10212_003976 [Sporobolomyces blumeae]
MPSARRPTRTILAGLLFAAVAQAMVVISPDGESIWDRTGKTRTFIKWSLDPPTDPPPRSNLFTIWLRNGAPDMYDPPLNLTLARHVDMVAKSQVEVQDVVDFLAGPGYQLFMADPDDASIVYCESPVFDIEDDPEVALERRRQALHDQIQLQEGTKYSERPSATSASTSAESRTSASEPDATTAADEAESTSVPEEPDAEITTTEEPAPETTDAPASSSAAAPVAEETSRSRWWKSTSSSSPADSSTEAPPPEEPSTSSEPAPPPGPTTTTQEPVTSSPSSTTSPSASPTPAPPPSRDAPLPPSPPPAATSSDSTDPSSSSSSRDFYWYYSVSDTPAPAPTPVTVTTTVIVSAAQALATVESTANSPCTCNQNAFQILVRPIPGGPGDQGLQLFTTGSASSVLQGGKGGVAVVGVIASLLAGLWLL